MSESVGITAAHLLPRGMMNLNPKYLAARTALRVALKFAHSAGADTTSAKVGEITSTKLEQAIRQYIRELGARQNALAA